MTAKKQRHCSHCYEPIHAAGTAWIHDNPTEGSAAWCMTQNRTDKTIKPAAAEAYRCQAGCGRTLPTPVRHHSGVRECGTCWNWRKMDGPMARYWHEKIRALFSEGPDMWDYQTFERMGMRDEVVEALLVLDALEMRMDIAINTPPSSAEHAAALGYDIQPDGLRQ